MRQRLFFSTSTTQPRKTSGKKPRPAYPLRPLARRRPIER